MRVLYLVPYAPTLIRTRPYNLIQALARRDHEVTLATLYESESEFVAVHEMAEKIGLHLLAYPLSKLRKAINLSQALCSRDPLQARFSWQPELVTAVQAAIETSRFEVVQVEHLRGSPYGLDVFEKRHKQTVIYDSVDCISLIYEKARVRSSSPTWKWITAFELPRTRRYEARMVREFDHVLVTSEKDRNALGELAKWYLPHKNGVENSPWPEERISVVPNGVDFTFFKPSEEQRLPATIVFSGKMSYHANLSAAQFLVQEIMPIVWLSRPDTRVKLVGQAPPRKLRELAISDERIEVTGWVKDIRAHLQTATLAIAPITYGAGIQNKVLEAMACSTPVVATSQAVSALTTVNDRDCLVGNTAQDLAECIMRLLSDPELWKKLSANGRKYVENSHNWDSIAEQLEGIYHREIEKTAR